MIPLFTCQVAPETDEYLLRTLHSGYLTQGPREEEFEGLLSEFIGNPNVATTNSGTSALTLALRAAGVGAGDVVLTTPMTCTATNLPILTAGATPFWIDVHPDLGIVLAETLADSIERARRRGLLHKIKAAMIVDWGGLPAYSLEIHELLQDLEIPLIEDAAHSFGASYLEWKIGNWADYTAFSFQAIKHLTTGDGGALFTKESANVDAVRLLRWYGIDRDSNSKDSRIDQDIMDAGYKFHMNDLNATLGISQLTYQTIDLLEKHLENATFLHSSLGDYFFKPSPQSVDYQPSWWIYTILLPSLELKNEFKRYMVNGGVQVSEVHRRNDEYTVFKSYEPDDLPGVSAFYDRMISLPCHSMLTRDQLDFIVELANKFAITHP